MYETYSKMINPESISFDDLPSVPLEEKYRLPSCSGIYFVRDNNDIIQYIGYSLNIRKRWTHHHRELDIKHFPDPVISWIEINTSDKDVLLDLELQLIQYFKPKLNVRIFDPRKVYPKTNVQRSVQKNKKGLLQLNIGSIDINDSEMDLLKVAANLSKVSMRQMIREILLDHLKTYKFYYQRQIDYVARKYGMSPEEAFNKLKTQEPPLGNLVYDTAPILEKSLSKEDDMKNIASLLAAYGIEDDGKDLLGNFADFY